MRNKKKTEEQERKVKKTPGPPARPKKRKERAACRIWLTFMGRGDRCWDTWIEDPTANGITVTPPWDKREHHFYVGEGEDAYNISFDEEHRVRRVIVYEDMSTSPLWLRRGEWRSAEDMAEAEQSYIKRVKAERMAEIQEAGEGFPTWGWALAIVAIVSAVSHVLSVGLG